MLEPYKTSFGLDGRSRPTPKKIIKAMNAIKGIIGAASISSFAASNPELAFWLLVAGAGIDELSKFFYEE